MTKHQIEKLTMYELVKDFLLASVTITNKWAVFAVFFALFKGYLAEIYSISSVQKPGKKYTTKEKAKMKADLAEQIQVVNDKCRGYARSIKNEELLSKFTTLKRSLLRLADIKLLATGDAMLADASPLVKDAGDYDLTSEDIETLTALLDHYREIFPQPKGKVKLTPKQTARIEELFGLCDGELINMDDVITSGRTTLPDFYSEYIFKRIIVKEPKHTRALMLQVNAAENGLPIDKATVLIWLKDHPESDRINKKTGKKGGIAITNLAAGIYQFEVIYQGYVKATGTFAVNGGKTTKVVVNMVKGM